MSWEIVLGIVTLIGSAITIVKPIISLTKVITELTESCKYLAKEFSNFEENNTKDHRRLWEANEKNCELLDEHESRITKLEARKSVY